MSAEAPAAWTVLRLINWTREHFAQGGLAEPRLSAEILLAHVLGCQRIELYARFDRQPPPEKLAAFRELIHRARQHEPIAYLVGQKEFYSLRFKVTASVMIPRPETEILVAEAVAHLRRLGRPGSVWDVGTGSGCIAVTIAVHVPEATVLATDISADAVAVAAENAAAHRVADRVRCGVADLLTLPDGAGGMKDFEVIAANPPYVADGEEVEEPVRHEPALALRGGPDGLDYIRPILRDAPRFLKPGGLLAVEFGSAQAEAVWDLIQTADNLIEPRILKDHRGMQRALVARRQ